MPTKQQKDRMKLMKRFVLAFALLSSSTFACAQISTQPAPTVVPVTESSSLPAGEGQGEGAYISFIINVHDWINTDESADILIKLVDLFERYNARGDFYFTADRKSTRLNS